MNLCEICKRLYVTGLAPEYPWIHCHHEEQEKICSCNKYDKPDGFYLFWRDVASLGPWVVPNFCPECGGKL